MPLRCKPALFTAALLLSGLAAAADQTVVLQAVQDTSIYFGTPGAEGRADGSGDYLWLAVTAEGLNRRMLVKFDFAAVPADAVVRQVSLTLYGSRARDEHDVALHRLLASWGEGVSNGGGQGTGADAQPGDATWVNRFHPNAPWLTPGGDFDATPSAVQRVGLPNTTYTWSGEVPAQGGPVPRIVSDVQGWLQNPTGNHGWVFIGAEAGLQNAKRFESRDNSVSSLRPKLTVVYTPAAVGGDADVPLPPWALLLLGAGLMRLAMVRSAQARR